MTNRIRINLVAFLVLAVVTIGWSVVNLFEFDRIERPYTVVARFDSTPGLAAGFEVTYLGHAIGSIDGVELRDGYSEVELEIDRGVELPAAVGAAARRKSAIGEPYVDLAPLDGTDPDDGPRLADGAVIPSDRTTSPLSYAELFSAVDGLVDAIDPDQLGILVEETADALDGRGDDIRSIITGADALTARTLDNADEIDRLIDDLGSITSTLAASRDAFDRSVSGLAELTETLEESQDSLDGFLTETPSAMRLFTRILEENDGSLLCTLEGLGALDDVADQPTLTALSDTIVDARALLDLLDDVTRDGGLRVTLQLSPLENAPRYVEPRPDPVAPQVPDCAPFDVPVEELDENEAAALGPGGDFRPTPDGEVDGAATDPDDLAAGRAGSSDLDRPGEGLLERLVELLVPALVALLLATAAWVMGRRAVTAWRAPTPPTDGAGPGEVGVDAADAAEASAATEIAETGTEPDAD